MPKTLLLCLFLICYTATELFAQSGSSSPNIPFTWRDIFPLLYIALVTVLFLRVWYLWNRDSKRD